MAGHRFAEIVGMLAAIGAATITTPANAGPQRPAVHLTGDAYAARDLCQTIIRSIATLPRGASTIDLESALVFAISQAPTLQGSRDKRQIGRIVSLALNCAGGSAGHRNLAAAISNVRLSYGIGTGATVGRGGGEGDLFGGGFSGPLVGIGGGSSNYTPR